MISVDINCDLAEGGQRDEQLMKLISSCNIACGGHFGDGITINKAVKLALENRVKIGAHPSYPDKTNFGRKKMNISLPELKKSVNDQIKRVFYAIKMQGGQLHHIKPHGALYNDLRTDLKKSKLIIQLIQEFDDRLILFVPPESVVKELAEGKLKTKTEGFADRNYEANFALVSRKNEQAILSEKEAVLARVLAMVKDGKITLKNKGFLTAKFDTICVHGDHQNSVDILAFLNEELPKNNIQISGR